MTSTVFKIKTDDALQIHGENSENHARETWYAVAKQNVDATDEDAELLVEYITPRSSTDPVWEFEGEQHMCPCSAIAAHVPCDAEAGPQYAWRELGFRMLDGSTMVRIDDEREVPIGDEDFECRSSDSEDDEDESLDGFIVKDEETEPFTFASGEFAQETHDAVRQFNRWDPPPGSRLANWREGIVRMERHAAALDDNRQYESGNSSISYNRPCTPE